MKRKALALATAAAALVLLLAACGGGDATSTPRPTDRPPTEPTDTPQPTATLAPGETPQPTATPAPTPTRRPTATPFPTPTPAPTSVGPPFYEGKTIRIIVNATPGGGYDAYARLVARHIGKHIPGNPDVIVQNLPGGNTLRGPNFIAVAAPRDGTVFGTIVNSNYMEQFLGEPGVEFDVTTLSWVGSPAFTTDTVYCRTDVVGDRTLEELAAAQQSGEVRKLFLGSSNPTAFVSHARILKEFVPGFDWDLVLGYPGGAEFRLAIRKGELDCAGGSKDSFLNDLSDMIEAGEINVLSTTGDANLDRDPTFPRCADAAGEGQDPCGYCAGQRLRRLLRLRDVLSLRPPAFPWIGWRFCEKGSGRLCWTQSLLLRPSRSDARSATCRRRPS